MSNAGGERVELEDGESRSFSHVRVRVNEGGLEGIHEVGNNFFHLETPHCADGLLFLKRVVKYEGADQRVIVGRVLDKCVYGKDDEFRVSFSVIDLERIWGIIMSCQVEIDELFQL